MANKVKRKEAEEKAEQKAAILNITLKKNKEKQIKLAKKKTAKDIYNSISLESFKSKEIRSLDTYVFKSYNESRQKVDLIKHLYVKYRIPNFIYNIFFEKSFYYDAVNYRHFAFEWFFCLAQGGSFQKLVKDIMTKKEVLHFFKAPDNYMVEDAFWYAKLKNAGVSEHIAQKLVKEKQFFEGYHINAYTIGKFVDFHLFEFFKKYHAEMDSRTFNEIADFLRFKSRNDDTFTLRGRTLNSVTLLSNEWHNLMMTAQYGKKSQWEGMGFQPWYWNREKHDETLWEVIELRSNHDLITEGRKQRHCVASYVSDCVQGRTAIFSLRKFNSNTLEENIKKRITIEVSNKEIRQALGYGNRRPSDDEKEAIRRFAREKELHISKYAWW